MQIRLYNTLTKQIEPFAPLRDNLVRMYSCGPTVYDTAHIGNMRAFLLPDTIQRVMRTVGGFEVRWVMNVTDIDDNTIRGSLPGSERWRPEMGAHTDDALANLRAYTRFFEGLFLSDLDVFGIRRDDFFGNPRATEFIEPMQALILDIAKAGYAYVSDGSVYFNVAAYRAKHPYGRLFHIDVEHFREGVRIDADQYDRESVSDFVLWKGRKDGEPYWDFDVMGESVPGRPGWHIECSAMSKDLLDLPFDIHTGGVDLRFPHHEDELAQCTAGYHVPEQAAFWVHNEFLEVEGRKMSKSLGNFYTLRDLIAQGIDPLDVRLTMLGKSYRSVLNFTFEGIRDASRFRRRVLRQVARLARICSGLSNHGTDFFVEKTGTIRSLQDLYRSIDSGSGEGDLAGVSIDDAASILSISNSRAAGFLFFDAMARDLNVALAKLVITTVIQKLEHQSDHELADKDPKGWLVFLDIVNDVYCLWNAPISSLRELEEVPENVIRIAEVRWEARLAKNWAESDRLRDDLLAMGWVVKDGKDGYTLEPLG